MDNKNTAKRLIIKLICGVVLIYAMSWAVYGLGYLNAKRSVSAHYGAAVKIKECTGGADSRDVLVNSNSFTHDIYQANGVTKLVPSVLLPFLSFNDYQYIYYYSGGHDIRKAEGRTNAFGNLRESSNTQWEYSCLLA